MGSLKDHLWLKVIKIQIRSGDYDAGAKQENLGFNLLDIEIQNVEREDVSLHGPPRCWPQGAGSKAISPSGSISPWAAGLGKEVWLELIARSTGKTLHWGEGGWLGRGCDPGREAAGPGPSHCSGPETSSCFLDSRTTPTLEVEVAQTAQGKNLLTDKHNTKMPMLANSHGNGQDKW